MRVLSEGDKYCRASRLGTCREHAEPLSAYAARDSLGAGAG